MSEEAKDDESGSREEAQQDYYCPCCEESTKKLGKKANNKSEQNSKRSVLKLHKLPIYQTEDEWRWCDYPNCCPKGKEQKERRIGVGYQCENGEHDYCTNCIGKIKKRQDTRER